MTWPTSNISTANLDNDADSPLAARPDLKAAVDNLNEMRSHVTPFAAGLLDDADAVAARATLELGTAATANTGTGPTNVITGNDSRLTNSREWTAETVAQAEAEAGTATTRRAWTAQRVRQAVVAWWESAKGALVGPISIASGGFSVARTAVTAPAASDGNIFSGTYTPTLTNVANVSSSTSLTCHYMRVGNVVTVGGQIVLVASVANTDTELLMSLPLASVFTLTRQCGGAGGCVSAGEYGESIAIQADINNGTANIRCRPSSAGTSQTYNFTFTYRIA